MTGQVPPLPAGYKLEQPQGDVPPLPPGYSLEPDSVASRPGVPRPQLNVGNTAGLGTATGPGMVPNPKTAIAMAGDDPSGFTGEGIAGLTAVGTMGTIAGAAGETAAGAATMRALVPIAKKYGIKALEGAGLGMGWHLYRELKNVFEGNQ